MNLVAGIVAAALALVAAGLHVTFFALESLLWSRPSTWRTFGVRSAEDAEVLRGMAWNQGFYNLFLALGAVAGSVLLAVPSLRDTGIGLLLLALGSMTLAGLALAASAPRMRRAALLQAGPPAAALVALVLAITLG